jgi:hypothetical protein
MQRKHLLPLLLMGVFASCEKIINVDVKDSEQKLVIEGTVNNEPGVYTHKILLSKTNKLSAENNANPFSGALVVVEDLSINQADTALEKEPGMYITQKTQGVPGHTYKLSVLAEGKMYTSESTMPEPVTLDSLYTEEFSFFGETFKQIIPVFQDPPGAKNYYRFSTTINDSSNNNFQAWDDQLSDGKLNSRPLFNNDEPKKDDTVTVFMSSTDKPTFDFFNTLENAQGSGQTPSNPISNIPGAMGYFSALTIQRKTIIIP